MNDFEEGCVVICSTCQAGTLAQIAGQQAWVLLACRDVWVGNIRELRIPQDQADLDACPLEVERSEKERSPRED